MKTSIFLFLITIFSLGQTYGQWIQVQNGMGIRYVYALASGGNNLFAGVSSGGVFLSTNDGTNWTQTSLTSPVIHALLVNGNSVFAGTAQGGVYLSTNNGVNWTQTSLNNHTIYSLSMKGNTIFAGSDSTGVYKTTNNGVNWIPTTLTNSTVYSLSSIGGLIIAGLMDFGLRLSTDDGLSWIFTNLNNTSVFDIEGNDSVIFAGTFNGVYKSTNFGFNWLQTSLSEEIAGSVTVSGNNIFAGTFSGGVYVSNDNGITWTQRNEGMTTNNTEALSILNNFIFVGGQKSVFRRPLNELIGIQQISNEVPVKFSLSQNYPNPFNPTTRFEFQSAKSGLVTIKIFDINGREAETLVDEYLNAGAYIADWNASGYSSGVYFYKIETGNFSETKKMLMIK